MTANSSLFVLKSGGTVPLSAINGGTSTILYDLILYCILNSLHVLTYYKLLKYSSRVLIIKFALLLLQNDVEMPIPKYFVLEKAKALKEREKLLGQILSRLGAQDRDAVCRSFSVFSCAVLLSL